MSSFFRGKRREALEREWNAFPGAYGSEGSGYDSRIQKHFRDYIGEKTNLDAVVAEHCLAHKVGDATERAYARGDMLEKRFHMMNIWADYVTSKVVDGATSA